MNSLEQSNSLRDRIREQILDDISQMNFDYSTKLMSEQQMAEEYSVSRSTIRAALAELEMAGIIIRRHGSGTYVNTAALKVKTTLYPKVDTYSLIANNGFDPSCKIISIEEGENGDSAENLNLSANDKVFIVKTLYYADGKACIYVIDKYSSIVFKQLDWDWQEYDFKTMSFYDYIYRKTGIQITWDIVRIASTDSGKMPELKEYFPHPQGTSKSFVCLELLNFSDNNEAVVSGTMYVDDAIIDLHLIRDIYKS